jgi:hypothetical protein
MSRLFLTIFINKVLEDWVHADTLTFCESTPFVSISQIFYTLTCGNYFYKESTLFEKFKETRALYPVGPRINPIFCRGKITS